MTAPAAVASGLTCACHSLPTWRTRCQVTGHRRPGDGVPPVQTRDLVFADPVHAVKIVVLELTGRARARRAGRKAAA
jgi:hypothetical protein